jgi:hypothetical protein
MQNLDSGPEVLRSDAAGRFTIATNIVRKTSVEEVLYLWNPEFIPEIVTFHAAEQTIVMHAARRLIVECSDIDTGAPIANANLVASEDPCMASAWAHVAQFAESSKALSWVPGPNPGNSVAAGRTGVDGLVTLRGFAGRELRVACTHDHYTLVEASEPLDKVLGDTLKLKLVQVYASVIETTDANRVLAWCGTTINKNTRRIASGPVPVGVKEALRARFKNAQIRAIVPSKEAINRPGGPSYDWDLFVDGVGWVQRRMPLVAASAITRPEIIELPEATRAVAGKFTWDTVPSFKRWGDDCKLDMRLDGTVEGQPVTYLVTAGREATLPFGTYLARLASDDLTQCYGPPSRFTFGPLSPKELLLKERFPLFPVHLQVVGPPGMRLPRLSVSIDTEGKNKVEYNNWYPDESDPLWNQPPVVWLLPGHYELSILGPGIAKSVLGCEVSAAAQLQSWRVSVRNRSLR